VLAGGQVFPEVMDGAAAPAAAPAPCGPALTAKQLQVLELLSQGQSNKGIANNLGLSPNTIKIHVTEILRKLGVSSRSQAVALVRNNWPAKGPTG
jgi:DNA-binding NarL/FixJ family response regulator